MSDYSDYTVFVSNEPCYYGSDCSQEDADEIVERLTAMIKDEFPYINVREWYDGSGSCKTIGPDEIICNGIDDWIASHWSAAL